MVTMEEYATQTRQQRLERLARTPDELAAAIRGKSDAEVSRRPDPKNWAAKEVLCHLRDTEESFIGRFETIIAMDEPTFLGIQPDRWAEERQYLRCDGGDALTAFRTRRRETLDFLRKLPDHQWQRGGRHATRGRLTIDDFLTMMAWHDDNHLAQLGRALAGRA